MFFHQLTSNLLPRYGDWNQADIEILNKHLFITAKSMIYLVNLSEKDFMRKKNKWLPKIKEYIDKNDPGATVIPFSGTFEQKLMDFESDDERKAYCEETKCTSILDKIVVQGYKALQLQYFFTAGEDEVTVGTLTALYIHCPSFPVILTILRAAFFA